MTFGAPNLGERRVAPLRCPTVMFQHATAPARAKWMRNTGNGRLGLQTGSTCRWRNICLLLGVHFALSQNRLYPQFGIISPTGYVVWPIPVCFHACSLRWRIWRRSSRPCCTTHWRICRKRFKAGWGPNDAMSSGQLADRIGPQQS